MHFRDRKEAGALLAKSLESYRNEQAVVYALPRGGVVPGVIIAQHLGAPLDLAIPRKIGHQLHPEYAICAITEDGHLVCNEEEVRQADPTWLEEEIKRQLQEAKRRRTFYGAHREPEDVTGKVAIITDDGVATGLTMLAAIQEVRAREPAKIVLAVPIMPQDTAQLLGDYVEEVVALHIPEQFAGSVGAYYDEFEQVEDKEVMELLDQVYKGGSEQKGEA